MVASGLYTGDRDGATVRRVGPVGQTILQRFARLVGLWKWKAPLERRAAINCCESGLCFRGLKLITGNKLKGRWSRCPLSERNVRITFV